ncbi:MAG TPA: hypothetical protein VGL58_02275 [Caulobacteraceae bacterium]|jgi:hypothetical protein
MAATQVPALDYAAQLVEPASGRLTPYGDAFLRALLARTGGSADKVDVAHSLATAAVPQGTEVVAAGGLQNGGALGGNVGLALYRTKDAAANLPTSAVGEGDWAYALDGRKPGEGAGAGTGVPVIYSQGSWISAYSGAAVTT